MVLKNYLKPIILKKTNNINKNTFLPIVQITPSVQGGTVREPIYLKYFLLPNLISPGLTIPKSLSSFPTDFM